MIFVFNKNIVHDGKSYVKGQECPKEIHDKMKKSGHAEELKQVKPVEPPKPQFESKKE